LFDIAIASSSVTRDVLYADLTICDFVGKNDVHDQAGTQSTIAHVYSVGQSFEFRPKKMNFVRNSPISVGPGICTNRPKKFGPF
jgi:hypothetical protein